MPVCMRVLPRLEREAALCCREELNEELKAEVQRFEAFHRNATLPPVREQACAMLWQR